MSTSAGVFVFEQHRILRLDPTTLRVTGNLGGSRPLGAFAYGDGSLWAVAGAPKKRVLRIDPTTFKVIQTIPVSGLPQSVAFGDGRVWVTVIQSSPNDLPNGTAPRMLERINPTTSKITGHTVLTGPNQIEEIVVGNAIAVAGWRGPKIQLINPTTMRVVRSVPGRGTYPKSVPLGLQGPPRIVSLAGQLYLRKADGSIVRLATDGPESTIWTKQEAATHHMDPGGYVTSAQGLLWLQGGSHFYGIDPALGRITATSAAPGRRTIYSAKPRWGWVASDPDPATPNGTILALVAGDNYFLDRLGP
jgi:hypothetical protein